MKGIFEVEPWKLNDRPKEPAFKVAPLNDDKPMGNWLTQLVASNQCEDWRNAPIDCGYCLDAPEIGPFGGMAVLRVPPQRSDPVEIQTIHVMIRPKEYTK